MSFYNNIFGRQSVDDHGKTLVSSVHFGQQYDNAFWNGQQMVYGDGDGVVFQRFTSALDVVANELTHDTGGEFGDGRKSRALRHFDSRMRMSLRESRRFLIDNLSFHLILQSMDGHVTSIAPNRPDS